MFKIKKTLIIILILDIILLNFSIVFADDSIDDDKLDMEEIINA